MNFLKKFFIAICLLSQINALQAMNGVIQVPTKEQIQQIRDTYSFYNKLSSAPVLAVAGYWLYRSNFKCGKEEECSGDSTALLASAATIPLIVGCAIRKQFLDYEYEECAFNPLLQAIQADDKQAVSKIVDADSVNMRSPLSGITPLRMATLEQKEKIVAMLLREKKARTEDEVVFDAIKTGNANILTLLLKGGCRYNAKQPINNYGFTYALHYAIRNQQRACAQALLDAGAHQCRTFAEMYSDGWPGHNAYELAKIHRMEDVVTHYKPRE